MLVMQEDLRVSDHNEVVLKGKINKRNIWYWTHSKRVCQTLFGCDWKQLDLVWMEECKESFKSIPDIEVRRLSGTEEGACARVSRFLYIPEGKHYKTSAAFSNLLIINDCASTPGIKASAKALMSLRNFTGIPVRTELTKYLTEDAFYALYKAGLLRKIQLFGHSQYHNAYYYCPKVLKEAIK